MYARNNDAFRANVLTNEGIFASGSFKDVYKAVYTEGSRAGQQAVAKFMRGADPYLKTVFDCELEVVAKAEDIITRFNDGGFVNKKIYLNKPQVWVGAASTTPGWEGKAIMVEPRISDYQKFNSNSGWVANDGATWGDVMQALSHFSYHATGGSFVLCDLQGGFYRDGIVLTDPVVMSRSQQYGATDLGADGLTAFFNHHQCNRFCCAHWTRPKMRVVNIIPKRGTSMMNSKGQMLVPTHQSRAPISRPAVPKFNAIKEEPW